MITRYLAPSRATEADVHWLLGPVLERAVNRFAQLPLVMVVDLHRLTGRDPEVRKLLFANASKIRQHVLTVHVVPPLSTAIPLFAIRASATLLRTLGLQIVIESSFASALESSRLRLDHRPVI